MALFCGCTDVDCSVCYLLEASFCPETINIPCGLTPATQYYVWIQDFSMSLFYDLVTSDASGDLLITCSNFPDIFNSHEGALTVFVTQTDEPINLITMNFITPSNCVSLRILPPIYLTNECGNYLTDENGNYILVS